MTFELDDDGFGGAFPFTHPAESEPEASMFIQWKGTDVCLDFVCSCGEQGHFDGDFAYALRCPSCDGVFELGTQVILRRNDAYNGTIQILDVDDA